MRLAVSAALFAIVLAAACQSASQGNRKQLILAVNSGVEGDALKQAARDYEALTGVHVNISEWPYANLFEKELLDLNARTGAYDLIMLDDPWFPKFSERNVLTDLTPLMQKRGLSGPDPDFGLTRSLPQPVRNRNPLCFALRR
jgi:multiple sugar transport system substrate-binding protein